MDKNRCARLASALQRSTSWAQEAEVLCRFGLLNLRLLRELGEYRQLADITGVMLDDDGGLEVRGHLLQALDRGNCLRAIVVERGHADRIPVLVEMHGVT